MTAIAVLPVVARTGGEVFDHSTAVLVRACVPGFGMGLAVAACAAAAVAMVPGIAGLALGGAVATLVVLAGLLGLRRHEKGPMPSPPVVAGVM